jgi:hypothetical protein
MSKGEYCYGRLIEGSLVAPGIMFRICSPEDSYEFFSDLSAKLAQTCSRKTVERDAAVRPDIALVPPIKSQSLDTKPKSQRTARFCG